MKTPDLTYQQTGAFTRFYPETDAGREAWDVMADENGVAAVLNGHSASVLRQLRKAGYSVAKANPVTEADMDAVLAELGI